MNKEQWPSSVSVDFRYCVMLCTLNNERKNLRGAQDICM